jgi:CubicO group peptidase (beta-lactamase class C family)
MQRFFIGFSIVLAGFSLSAQTEPLKTNLIDQKIDSIVKNYLDNPANYGLSIAICRDKQVTYYNFGSLKKGVKQAPTNKTIYEIGSISKTFTGIMFAKAILDKKMNLNDPVKNYLGEDYKNLSYKGKNIELVHLANHSGRIHRIPFDLMSQPGYDMNDPYKNYSKEMVLAYMKKIMPDTFPGAKSEYSNLGMGLLGIIEEKVYDKNYEELITENICKPLLMNDTKITIPSVDTARFAKGHDADGKQVSYWDLGALLGAGGIRSTTEDMMKYLRANMEETDPAIKLSHQTTFKDDRNNIGLAWHIVTTKKGNEMIWHNGRTGGFSSFCAFIKSKDLAVVVLGNSSNPVDQVAIGILKFLQ